MNSTNTNPYPIKWEPTYEEACAIENLLSLQDRQLTPQEFAIQANKLNVLLISHIANF